MELKETEAFGNILLAQAMISLHMMLSSFRQSLRPTWMTTWSMFAFVSCSSIQCSMSFAFIPWTHSFCMKPSLEVSPLGCTYLMMESPIRSLRALLVIVSRDKISRGDCR